MSGDGTWRSWVFRTADEDAVRTAELRNRQSFHSEMAKYKNLKPDAPFVNLGNLKSLVKELLDKHFRKIAITTAISFVVSVIFTWLVWPKSEGQKLAEAKAAAEKMETELQKAKEETARLAKEKEELLTAKAKELAGQKQTEAQNIKNDGTESKEEKKSGNPVLVALGFFIGILGIAIAMSASRWSSCPKEHTAMIVLPSSLLALAMILIIPFWPRSEEVSEDVVKNPPAKIQAPVQIKNPTPAPKFKANAVILYKVVRFDKFWSYSSFDVQLHDGQKGRLVVDEKFFNLAKCGERIAIYENNDFRLDQPVEEKKEEPKKPEEKPKKKERTEY